MPTSTLVMALALLAAPGTSAGHDAVRASAAAEAAGAQEAPMPTQTPAEAGDGLPRAARPLAPRAARALGVGRFVDDAPGRTPAGATAGWHSGAGELGTVVAFVDPECPLSQKLAPSLARLEARALAVGVRFVHVGVGADDGVALAEHARQHGWSGLVLHDGDGALAARFDARTTTEVFLVDARGTLRYRGALDDQYGLGFALPAPRHAYLEDALRALLRAQEPAVAATTAPGCLLERGAAPRGAAATVTYARDVARLVQASCLECHRAGGVAPFALDTYEAVARRAAMLAAVVEDGLMPPWFAAETDAHGGWANDRSLAPEERGLLRAWIAAGKPRGDEAELPLPRAFDAAGWRLGEPDAVFALPRPSDVPAEGRVDYRYTPVPTDLGRDRWVRAIEVRPGAPEVVHHVVVYALPAEAVEGGRVTRWDLVDERRGFFAAWAPGAAPVVYPEGHARALEAGTVLLFELHYTPNGRAARDLTRLGVHFASEDPAWRPERVVRTAGVSNRGIEIPAGAAAHVETSTGVAARGLRLQAFMPHMHLRGAAFRYERVAADGTRTTLLDVPRYDFNWQLRYELSEPVDLAAGERLDVRGVFDNSAANPANPAPDRPVGWGPQTDDEMLIGFVDYVLVEEDLALTGRGGALVVLEPRVARQLRALAERSGGVLRRVQLPRGARADFDRLDRDGDGLLGPTELPLLRD